MDKKVLKFSLSSEQLQLKQVLNNDFLRIEVKAISNILPNRNDTHFTLESIKEALESGNLKNRPILGAFKKTKTDEKLNRKDGDFGGHDGELAYDADLQNLYYDYDGGGEIPLGVIRSEDEVWIEEEDDLSWLCFDAVLWTSYSYRAIKNLVRSKKKKVSVEIEVLESHMETIDEKEIEFIDSFNFLGCTILGSDIKEGIPGAHLSVLDVIENALFSKQVACLEFAYKGLNDNGINADSTDSVDEVINTYDSNISDDNLTKEVYSLTYQTRIELLSKVLIEHFNEDSEKECAYAWVQDLDETHCYFNYEGETFMAPYFINIGEDGESIVTIDFDNQERVIRTWEKFQSEEKLEVEAFSEDSNNRLDESAKMNSMEGGVGNMEVEKIENTETSQFAAQEEPKKEVESCGKAGCEAQPSEEADKEVEACGCGGKESEACGDKPVEEESCGKVGCEEKPCEGEPKEEESCGKVGCEQESCGKVGCEQESCGKIGCEQESCGKVGCEQESCGKIGCEEDDPDDMDDPDDDPDDKDDDKEDFAQDLGVDKSDKAETREGVQDEIDKAVPDGKESCGKIGCEEEPCVGKDCQECPGCQKESCGKLGCTMKCEKGVCKKQEEKCGSCFTVKFNNEEITTDELINRYNDLSDNYNKLNEKYAAVEEELTKFREEANRAKHAALEEYANSLIDSITEFSADEDSELVSKIKGEVYEAIAADTYSTNEAVEDLIDGIVGKELYVRSKKMRSNNSEKEFSAPIANAGKQEKAKKNCFDRLKEF